MAVDCGLPETQIPSGEPTTHRDKDHHGYAMVVHRDKLYRSDQLGLSKPIRDPTHPKDPTRTNLKPTDPTILAVDGRCSPPRNRLRRVGFGFYPPKPKKPELTGEKPRFQ